MDDHPFCTGMVIEQDNNLYFEGEDGNGVFYDDVPIYTIIPEELQLISESKEH